MTTEQLNITSWTFTDTATYSVVIQLTPSGCRNVTVTPSHPTWPKCEDWEILANGSYYQDCHFTVENKYTISATTVNYSRFGNISSIDIVEMTQGIVTSSIHYQLDNPTKTPPPNIFKLPLECLQYYDFSSFSI
jgi:hypothetical protein